MYFTFKMVDFLLFLLSEIIYILYKVMKCSGGKITLVLDPMDSGSTVALVLQGSDGTVALVLGTCVVGRPKVLVLLDGCGGQITVQWDDNT